MGGFFLKWHLVSNIAKCSQDRTNAVCARILRRTFRLMQRLQCCLALGLREVIGPIPAIGFSATFLNELASLDSRMLFFDRKYTVIDRMDTVLNRRQKVMFFRLQMIILVQAVQVIQVMQVCE